MRGFPGVLGLVAVAALAGACATSPKASFYTLSATASAQGPAASDFSVLVTGVGIPELVDRPQLVLRAGENRVDLAEAHRWGEPLKEDLGRVVAQNLSRLLGQERVAAHPLGAAIEADFRVRIDVQRLESRLGEATELDALWSVRATGDGRQRTGRTLAREPAGEGHESLVAAHSRAVAKLSGDIAAAIRSLLPPGE